MFINLEKGNLKLYDLKIYKRIEGTKLKLAYETSCSIHIYETTDENFAYEPGLRISKNRMIGEIIKEDTGNVILYEDNSFSPIYKFEYEILFLNEIYYMLEDLQNNDYSKLELLNKYLNGKIKNENLSSYLLFNKYKTKIMNNIKLVELLSEDYKKLEKIYNELLKKSNGDLKKALREMKKYLNIYEMNLDCIPKVKKYK